MSRKNLAYKFPRQNANEIERQITHNIREILRSHYQDFPSALKWLCARTDVRPRTARNWYEGCNPPSSGNLVVLARSYPAILRMILQLAGRHDLAALCIPEKEGTEYGPQNPQKSSETDQEGAIFCTINVTISLNTANRLNQRQLWFLGMIQQGYAVKAEHITGTWGISLRTAKYDIADLVETGLIRYLGPKGAGQYILTA